LSRHGHKKFGGLGKKKNEDLMTFGTTQQFGCSLKVQRGKTDLLTHLDPASSLAVGLLIFSFALVIAFEASNGFHDTANAVATVIYTKSLPAIPAVIWSGLMNFTGVLVGGIAVAYALVELLPPDVLSPPSGAPAVAMLVALFLAALAWNVGTWWFGLPNSSSHCLIGSLIGIAVSNALIRDRSVGQGVHWAQVWTVLEGLALSPVIGFILAGGLYFIMSKFVRDSHLYKPVKDGKAPVWWVRGLLILTCAGVSLAHGSNDGQKSIGLIMLTIIGLLPAVFGLNPTAGEAIRNLPQTAGHIRPLIQKYGDDEKDAAIATADKMEAGGMQAPNEPASIRLASTGDGPATSLGLNSEPARRVAAMRDGIYQLVSQLKHIEETSGPSKEEIADAKRYASELGSTVEYAPWWVRILSAVALGVGTMFGYRRIVTTLGERLGKIHMTPAQGASAEVVSAVVIGAAGLTGLPVSTTHIVTSGIAGTMVTAGAGLQYSMLYRIAIAWLLTLPVTVLIAGGLYYLLAAPNL
jgi:inorganic phosphate transporter, PiT family